VVARRSFRERGLTLVELMVTMVIASIVAAATFVFFAGQQRVYETQTKLLNVQQNAWASMEVLTRFVRANGSGMFGCVRPVGGIVISPPLNRTLGVAVDLSDDPPVSMNTGTGALVHNLSVTPNAGLRAYDKAGAKTIRIPPLWIVDNVDPASDASAAGIVEGTDVITVAFGNRSSGTLFDSPLSNAAVTNAATNGIIIPGANTAMFQAPEFIVLVGEPGMGGNPSDIGCTLLQITGVSTGTLSFATDGNATCVAGGPCTGSRWNPGSGGGGAGAMIPDAAGYGIPTPAVNPTTNLNTGVRNFGELWWVRFAIRTADSAGNGISNYGLAGKVQTIPVLTMERLDGSTPTTPMVLAEGIEDLQVAFACDLNADGTLTEVPDNADEWTLNVANDPVPLTNAAKCNQPAAVRLTLIARSLSEDTGINAALTGNKRPAAENHAAGAVDQFRRRVLTTTVYPRNN
jgi:prepilin-type N-terminal cleavage/methylation domain-containing protein